MGLKSSLGCRLSCRASRGRWRYQPRRKGWNMKRPRRKGLSEWASWFLICTSLAGWRSIIKSSVPDANIASETAFRTSYGSHTQVPCVGIYRGEKCRSTALRRFLEMGCIRRPVRSSVKRAYHLSCRDLTLQHLKAWNRHPHTGSGGRKATHQPKALLQP